MIPLPNDPFINLFNKIAATSFCQNLYYWQSLVGSMILHSEYHNTHIQQLCVRPTGGGKTLLWFTVIARWLKGITLCIVLPLSLGGADQCNKFLLNTTPDKSITAFYIVNKLGDDHITNLITSLTSDQRLHPTKVNCYPLLVFTTTMISKWSFFDLIQSFTWTKPYKVCCYGQNSSLQ